MRPPRASIVAVAALAFVAGALVVVDRGGRRAEGTFAPGSVFSETPEGLSLAYRYLGEGGDVSVLSETVRSGALPADGVLFRIRPIRVPFRDVAEDGEEKGGDDGGETRRPAPPRPLLTSAEEDWVRGGGRLVLGLSGDYGPVAISRARGAGRVQKVFPLWPGVDVLQPGATSRGVRWEPAHAVFVQGARALLSRLALGEGEVLVLAVPELLENGRLATADHLGLLDALAGTGRPVVFDEWIHGLGQDESVVALMLEWGLGPALVVGLVAFALLLWRERTRLGPEEDDATDERSEAVDLVDSLAQLYDRALSRREAARLQLQGFRQAVALRTGLQGPALERRTRELLDEGAALPPGEREIPTSAFLRALHAVNDGYRRLEEHAHSRRRP